jgi:hypothetical protein
MPTLKNPQDLIDSLTTIGLGVSTPACIDKYLLIKNV